jgi:hypothetical protein
VKFIKTRQNQASRVPGTNTIVRISEQTSIKPETAAEGYFMRYSRNPACQRVIEERDRLAAECTPKPTYEPLVESLTWTVNEQLNARQCEAAARTVGHIARHVTCAPKRKRRKR